MCKIHPHTVGHGELDCGSGDFAACWLAALAAREHVEILELFQRIREKGVRFRQADTFRYKYTYTYTFIIFFFKKTGIKC